MKKTLEVTHAVVDSTKVWIKSQKRKVMILVTTVVILATMMDMLVTMVVMLVVMMSQETMSFIITCMLSLATEYCNDTQVLIQ